eukprot:2871841-Pyramimonas_sp.AAC.1
MRLSPCSRSTTTRTDARQGTHQLLEHAACPWPPRIHAFCCADFESQRLRHHRFKVATTTMVHSTSALPCAAAPFPHGA